MLTRLLRRLKAGTGRDTESIAAERPESPVGPLSEDIEQNICQLKTIFDRCSDVVTRQFNIGSGKTVKVFLIYMHGLADREIIEQHVTGALQFNSALFPQGRELSPGNAFTMIRDRLISASEIKTTGQLAEVVVRYGLETICRANEFVFPLLMISLAIIAALALPDADFSNLLPVLDQGIRPVLGWKATSNSACALTVRRCSKRTGWPAGWATGKAWATF